MKAIKSILVAAIPATIIIGCGGGSSNNTPQTNTLPAGYTCTKNNICGPIGIVNAELVTDRIKQKSRPNPNKQLNTADTDVGLGALGIVSFLFPEFAPVVAVASITSDFYNGFNGNLVQTTANLAESINQLNTQLNTLQSQVFNNQNIFYNYVTANESIEAQQAYNTVQNDINNIAGNMNNTVTMNYKYYTNSNWLTGQNDTPNNNYPNAASIAASYPAMNLLNSYTTSEIFGPALDNLSNSVTCSNNGVVTIYPYDSAAGCGNVNDSSDIITLYNYLQQQLTAQLSQITLGQAPSNSSLEAKSLFNQYNNSIATIFENSLVALQTAYNIEANNNLLNYLAVTTGNANNQILPYNAIGSIIESSNGSYTCSGGCTSFYITTANPSTESSNYQMAYESAANNLTQVYVNRLNQLVLSTVPYIVSDHFKPQQLILNSELQADSQMQSDFTTNPATISMFGNTYSVKSPQELYESTQEAITYKTLNNQLLLPVPDGNWDQVSGGSFFYQYSGLSDYIGCANMNNCQSFFPNSSSAQYNGQYYSAYNVGQSNQNFIYPFTGMLLAYPTNILNCKNPTTESFTMVQMASNISSLAVACNDSLSNENVYIMDAGHFNTSFTINTPPLLVNNATQFQNSSANTTSTPNSVYLSSFGNVNTSYNNNAGIVNNIGIMFPETQGLGSAYILVDMSSTVQSMLGKGTVAFNMSANAITVVTNGSQLGTGLFCYSNTNTLAPGVAAVAICTNYNSGNSYTLQLNIGNWTVSWTPYNIN